MVKASDLREPESRVLGPAEAREKTAAIATSQPGKSGTKRSFGQPARRTPSERERVEISRH